MWPWIKRWRDWAMHDLWPLYRVNPQPQAVHFSFEKGGLTLHDQPVPWNAEAVLVEASLRLSNPASRRKAEYSLRLPGREPIPAEHLRRAEGEDRYHLLFRLPPPGMTATVELFYHTQVLGQLTIPFLSREDFLQGLRVQMPTLFVRIGEASVACQTFVSNQCKGILASAMLLSPTSLVPLLDLDLQVEFRCERTGSTHRVSANLCSSQLAGRQALVTVAPRRHPRRIGNWSATWLLGDRPLTSQRVRGISQRAFQKSLRISDTRFVVKTKTGTHVGRQPPQPGAERIGPCFLVSSGEPGMAGLVSLQVTAQVPGAVRPPLLQEQVVLISDGPTPVMPGTLDAADLVNVTGFELSIKGRSLGVLSSCSAPAASFTSEGGFKPPSEFSWSPAAEEEMNERLNRLFNAGGGKS